MQIPEALKKVLTEEQLTEIKAEFDKISKLTKEALENANSGAAANPL